MCTGLYYCVKEVKPDSAKLGLCFYNFFSFFKQLPSRTGKLARAMLCGQMALKELYF